MKTKDTIINEMVLNAAHIMEAKIEFDELVASQMSQNGDWQTAKRLRLRNVRIADAISVIRELDGCWA